MDATFIAILVVVFCAITFSPVVYRWFLAQRAARQLQDEQRRQEEEARRIKEEHQRRGGEEGERRVKQELQRLKGRSISGYISTKNLYIPSVGNFELDALVLVPNVGLVVLEAKNYGGTLTASADDEWHQDKRGEVRYPSNPCLQALRQAQFLSELLSREGLNAWPIHAMVVIANPRTTLRIANGDNAPQTPVARLHELDRHISALPRVPVRFTREDFEGLQEVFAAYECEFAA